MDRAMDDGPRGPRRPLRGELRLGSRYFAVSSEKTGDLKRGYLKIGVPILEQNWVSNACSQQLCYQIISKLGFQFLNKIGFQMLAPSNCVTKFGSTIAGSKHLKPTFCSKLQTPIFKEPLFKLRFFLSEQLPRRHEASQLDAVEHVHEDAERTKLEHVNNKLARPA